MRGWVERRGCDFCPRAERPSRFCWPSSAGRRTPTICCAEKPSNALSPADRNLATALVLGVLRWQIRLDQQIKRLLKGRMPSSMQRC